MPLHDPSCKLRFARISDRLKFQDGPSVAIIENSYLEVPLKLGRSCSTLYGSNSQLIVLLNKNTSWRNARCKLFCFFVLFTIYLFLLN